MPRKVKIAIVGFGIAGKVFHAGLLKGLSELFEVSEVISSDARKVAEQLPDSRVLESIDELRNSPCESVIIATPSHTHFELAKRALEMGKHVVIDKPIAPTVAEAKELIEIARRCGCLLTVFQNRRWDNGFLTAMDLAKSGLIGEIVQFNSAFDRFRPNVNESRWREQNLPGSGMLYDLGSHLIDQALVLMGPPTGWQVDTAIQRERARQVDCFTVTVRFGERRAVLAASSLAAEPRPTVELFGREGAYVKHGTDPQEEQLRAGIRPQSREWGEEPAEAWGTLHRIVDGQPGSTRQKTRTGSYEEFYRLWHQSVTNGAPVPVTAESALLPLQIIESATQ